MANVEELIEKGYDLDVISLELEIPINTLMEIKQKIDEESSKRTENIESLNTMREKYNELFNKKYKSKNFGTIKEMTEDEIKDFENTKEILKKLAEQQRETKSSKQRKDNINKANDITKSILKLPLNFEQLDELFDLYNVEEFSNSYLSGDDLKKSKNMYIKKSITDKIAERIEAEMSLTNDWNKLNELSKRNKRKYNVRQTSKLEIVSMKLRMKMSTAYREKPNKVENLETSPLVDGIAKGLARWKFECGKSKRIY